MFRAAIATFLTLVVPMALNVSAQTILLPENGQTIAASGDFTGEGTDSAGSFSGGYFGAINQSADRALLFDVGITMDWSDGGGTSSGALYAGIIHRSMMEDGAVLGFNAYIDAGRLNDEVVGLVSVGAEYQPSLDNELGLLFGGNLYYALEDYTDTGAFGVLASVPRTGADAFVSVDYDLGNGLNLTGTGGVFGYVGTDFAQELVGMRLDLGATYALNQRAIISGSLGVRAVDGIDTELVASLGLQVALGGTSAGALPTMSSSGLMNPSEVRQIVSGAGRPSGVLVAPPTRHFGFGTPFTPVVSTGGGNTGSSGGGTNPQAMALLACQVELTPAASLLLSSLGQSCTIGTTLNVPLATSTSVPAGETVTIVFPAYSSSEQSVAQGFACIDRSNGNAPVAHTVISISSSSASITTVIADGMDVLCTVTFDAFAA